MKLKALFLFALLAALPALSRNAAAIEFPGPPPGPARAKIAGERIVLENNVLRAAWDFSGERLLLSEFTDRLSSASLNCAGSQAIRFVMADGAPAPALFLTGKPTLEWIKPNPQSVRLSGRSGFWWAKVPLASRDGKLRVEWRAALRDDANYVHLAANTTEAPQSSIKQFILIDAAAKAARVMGSVDGSPVAAGGIFAAVENPMANNRVEGGRILCSLAPVFPLQATAVLGVSPPGQTRRGFLYYLERERARPYAPFLHYNSWYDIAWGGRKMNEAVCREAVEVMGRELTQRRGAKVDSFVFDDGWDDNRTLWKFHTDFPKGFAPVSAAARKYQSAVGVWLSPWGGYGEAKKERMKYGREQGFETNDKGFSLAGPRYHERFRDVCLGMIRDYGVNYFKYDGIAQGSVTSGGGPYAGDIEALLRLIDELRLECPELFVNITTGTWPSPFWLKRADSIWRGKGDMGFQGAGSPRQQWINYRDGVTYELVVKRGPLYPLSSLMTQGICHSQFGSAAKFSTDPKEWRDEVRSFFASGTQLQELYIRPQLLTPEMWDALAEGAKWSRKNAELLADVHWIGGDPAKGEVYGWAAWSPRQGTIALRNPGASAGRITLDIAQALELPAGAPGRFTLQNPFGDSNKIDPQISAGVPRTFELAPFEVLVLEAIPIQ